MISDTLTRVPEHSSDEINQRLREYAVGRVAEAAVTGGGRIQQRLEELESEWDVERGLQTNFAAVTAVGVALGALVDRRWFLFSAGAAAFMIQHALQGWCPPLPVLRRLNFRAMPEIQQERYALKALRGDFSGTEQDPLKAFEAAR